MARSSGSSHAGSTQTGAITRVLYGFHAVNAYLARQVYVSKSGSSQTAVQDRFIREIYIAHQRQDARMTDLIQRVNACGFKLMRAEAAKLDSLAGHNRHQGVVVLTNAPPPYIALEELLEDICHREHNPPLLLVLDGVTDPHNLGACLRVADAMGVDAIIAPKDKSVGINATVSKVACGAAENVPYVVVTNLARALRTMKDAGIWIVGTDGEAETDLFHFDQTGALAWVMGAEGAGLRRLTREHCDSLVSIPMLGVVESLNVSVASGICLAESRRQRLLR